MVAASPHPPSPQPYGGLTDAKADPIGRTLDALCAKVLADLVAPTTDLDG